MNSQERKFSISKGMVKKKKRKALFKMEKKQTCLHVNWKEECKRG